MCKTSTQCLADFKMFVIHKPTYMTAVERPVFLRNRIVKSKRECSEQKDPIEIGAKLKSNSVRLSARLLRHMCDAYHIRHSGLLCSSVLKHFPVGLTSMVLVSISANFSLPTNQYQLSW